MKKLLLIAIGSGLSLCAMAQSFNSQPVSHRQAWLKSMGHSHEGTPSGLSNFYTQGTHSRNNQGKNARVATTGVTIGTAYNAFGTYDASTTALTVNLKTTPQMINMTHRECMGLPYGSGAYSPSFSTDGGNTWDSTAFVLFQNQTSRYPNGVIYNPKGNTDPMKAVLAVAGPWTDNTNWVKSVYGSIRFDTADRHEIILANGQPGVYRQDNGNISYMTSCDDSSVHVIGEGLNLNGNTWTNYLGAVLTTGNYTSASDTFHWTQQLIRPHLWSGYKGAPANAPFDSLGETMGAPGTAWSLDGSIGYVVIFGNLDSIDNVSGANLDFGTYQPIVYKTTDHGATWNMMPMYNFANIPNLVQHLQNRPTADSGRPYPMWDLLGQGQSDENDYDLVVDSNGHLHIVGSVMSAYYASPDSAYQIYSWLYPTYYIYDVYTTTATGGWQANFIDSMQCRPSYSVTTTAPWLSNATYQVNYGARIQASRTATGGKIFVTWNDDVNISDTAGMLYPDVKGWGYDVKNGHRTASKWFTNTNDQFFICVSDLAMTAGSSYTVPCVYIASPNNNDGTSPIEFKYQGGVVWNETDFTTGVNEVTSPDFSVSGNYPNPFNNTTQFNVSLEKESTVGVDVFNMLGEKVESVAPSKMAPGVHIVTLGGNGMTTGVYFYRVTVNNQTVTHKMVVNK